MGTQAIVSWSSTTVGEVPAGWTNNWGSSSTAFRVTDTGSIRWFDDPNYYDQDAFVLDALASEAEYEVLVKLYVGGGSGTEVNHGVVLRASGDSNNMAGYSVAIRGSRNILGITEVTGEFFERSVTSVSAPNSLNETMWIRARAEPGGVLKAKTWVDGTPEPASWGIDTVDTNVTTGGSGLFARDHRSNEVDYTYFSYGTGGLTAPSPGTTGIVMTISESATAADTESTQANLLSTISEAASASDTAAGRLSASLSVSESAGASDTDTGQYATSQEIIEAVQASDLTGTLLKAILTQNLSALASDTVSLKANYGLTISETASGTDSTAGKAALIATLSESASASDTESSQAALSATISESAQGSDSVSLPADGTVTISIGEASVASDGVSMSAHFSMTLAESAQAADLLSSKAGFISTISESTQASDNLAGRASLLTTIAEALAASDTFGGFSPSVYTLTIGEAVTALDSISASLAGLRGFVTATITINPMITGAVDTESAIAGTLTTEPIITGTITVS